MLKRAYLTARRPLIGALRPGTPRVRRGAARRLLVVNLPRLGDIALSTGALRALAQSVRRAKITVSAPRTLHPILQDLPGVVACIDHPGRDVRKALALARELRRHPSPDAAIDLSLDWPIATSLVARFAGAARSYGFDVAGRGRLFDFSIEPRSREHVLTSMRRLMTLVLNDDPGELLPALPRRARKRRSERRRLVVHPGATARTQRWQPERFAAAARSLAHEHGFEVVVVGAASETTLLDRFERSFGPDCRRVRADDVLALRNVLRSADLVLCNNSGPMHLAAALGRPTVSTHGPTVIERFAPVGRSHRVVHADLDCLGCNQNACPRGDYACMTRLEPARMVEAAQALIGAGVASTMCGITGFAGLPSDARIKAMTRALLHRGPDDEGTWVRQTPWGVVALGHRRLSVIDLEGGAQPLASEDGSIVAIVNGEIYNHASLRRELERKGHRFRTRSDCEVVVHLWEEHGRGALERLDGMYAFALWEERESRLWLARDPIGKKPLYLHAGDGWLTFGSEPKAIEASGRFPDRIDVEALNEYLRFGYVHAPRTFYAGLEAVPAGGWACWESGRISRGRHFRLADHIDPEAVHLDFAAAVDRTRVLVREAVEKRLVADVPVGLFLSGGVDSSLVATLAAAASSEPLRTFTVGHRGEDASYDERDAARSVARHVGAKHTEIRIEPAVDQLLDSILDAFDEPFADSSSLPTYLISQSTAHAAKVVLSGVGGDEGFAGYPRHLGLAWSRALELLPAPLRRGMARGLPGWIPESSDVFNLGGRMRRFFASAALDPRARYLAWATFLGESERASLLGDHARPDRTPHLSPGSGTPLDFAFHHDATVYLPDDLLRLVDRASMAHGLEVRAPFCDPKLLGFALGLRARVKLRGGFRLKAVLKEVARGLVPAEILAAPKRGFMVPVARWLRHELRPMVEDLLSAESCAEQGLLNPEPVQRLWLEHASGRANHAHALWALLVLQAWRRCRPGLSLEETCASSY